MSVLSDYLSLISVEDVSAYTGLTYDSAETLMMEQIIAAVIAQAEEYCDTEFVEELRYERLSLGDGLITPRYNVQRINGLFIGQQEVITVTAPNFSYSLSMAKDSVDESILLLQGPSSFSEITIGTKLMSQIITDIIAVGSGWSAVAGPDYKATAMAGTLWNGDYTGNDSNKFNLIAANTKVNCSRIKPKTFQCQEMINDGILIYTSGYSTLPFDLKDALIRFIIKSFTDRSSATIGDTKSETIGDYSYSLFTASELTTGGSLAINYYQVLDKYRNFDI